MTAKELIEILKEMPGDLEVVAMSEFDQANAILTVDIGDAWVYTGDNDRNKKVIVLD